MVRLLKLLVATVLVVAVLGPLAFIGFAWWDGSRLLGEAEKAGWLTPVPELTPLTPLEQTAATAVFGKTWDVQGSPCRTAGRFVKHYIGGGDRDGLSISQVLARDINQAVEPGMTTRAQMRQLGAACILEQRHDDATLLRLWLARAPLGEGVTSADSAAQATFSKPAAELTTEEAAKLLALFYNPALRDNAAGWTAAANAIAARTSETAVGVAAVRPSPASAPAPESAETPAS
jgi:hypothetical protein